MSVSSIAIPVNDQDFRKYEAAPMEMQERMQQLLQFFLNKLLDSSPQTLLTLMDDMS